eukprot:PITA_11791
MVKLSKALPPKVKEEYIILLSLYSNVFAWDYSDLKTYDTNIIQHTIPIKPNQKPFRQKLRRINPKLLPLIGKEVNKLYKFGIIVPIRFSDWISNLVPVRKKTGEIRLCIDFRNLNKVSLKDNYPLPKMDHILQRVVGASRMSLLDGYSGYNQILVHEDDRDKTTFTTPWGTFHYAKMPFGLKNAGAKFQWAMDMAFANEKDVFLVVYLDDLTVFSKSDEEHLFHLTKVFEKCRKYDISLNLKKILFAMSEGKLLGHIISKDGIRIDPARVKAIQQLEQPCSKKEIQSFNGKLNFLCRFIPNLAEHLREITNMLKKDSEIRWTEGAVKSFNLIKVILSLAPTLISPDYTQYFILFSFASEHTLAAVLMQKRDGVERPIAFFSRIIRDGALNYNIIEKQALALIKALKDFRVYILNSHVLAYVPNAAVKDVLVQTEPKGRRGKWIATLLEYDVEIKPTKLIKGQGIAKLMAEANLHVLDINLIAALSDEDEENSVLPVSDIFVSSPWYADIVYVLQNLFAPPSMPRNKARTLKLKAAKFCIIKSALYWKDPGGVLLNFLVEEEAKTIVNDFHKGDCGGHLFWKTTANKILRVGFYWPSLFSDWGLDFIGEIHPASSGQHRWILTTTDYFTKWIEAIPTRQATDSVIISFLENNILSRFGCPFKLITDNAATFKSKRMVDFCYKYNISLGHSTAYHPQGNGLAESSNKSLVNIIKKMLEINKKRWHKKLVNALWADRVSQKKSIGMSPFEIVYGIDAVFPTSLSVLVVRLLQEAGEDSDPMQRRINQMIHLQQTREEVFQNSLRLQERIKKIYDTKAKSENFQLEDVVLRWDARNEDKGKHGKFDNLWKGPYKIAAYRGSNAFLLKELNGDECPGGSVNGRFMKRYHA